MDIKLVLLIIMIVLIYICVEYATFKKNQYILTFLYDDVLDKYMVHGLWLGNKINCNGHTYKKPHDPTQFIKNNWYDKYHRDEENTLFKYEYEKHGKCLNLTSTEYLNLVKKLHEKYYKKYVYNVQTDKMQIWLYLDENFNYIGSRYKNKKKN